MTVKTLHFRVDNGDMTLIFLESGRVILTDINIRGKADDPNDPTPNVAQQFRKLLKRDEKGRLYVDAFLLTHPDEDHIRGLMNHFHLGPPSSWVKSTDKILIKEMCPRRSCSGARTRRTTSSATTRRPGPPKPGDGSNSSKMQVRFPMATG